MESMDDLCVVLYEPQDDINIGTVVRAAQNFGVDDVRLVRPVTADPERVLISAPNARGAVERLRHHDDLDAALSDCVRVFGATARPRHASQVVADPIRAAVETEVEGKVALLFGREDHGLPNEALDRCDVQITIPTSPDYRSLNLAQAVMLVLWEIFRRREVATDESAAPPAQVDTQFEPAPREQVERMIQQATSSLETIGFFKYGDGEHVMRSVRAVFSRAMLDRRELAIWFGIFKEIETFVERRLGGGQSTE